MILNYPGPAHHALDADRELMRTIVDYGPLAGRYLTARDERARAADCPPAAHRSLSAGPRPLAAGCRRLGAALVALGLRLQGLPASQGILPLPREQGVGA